MKGMDAIQVKQTMKRIDAIQVKLNNEGDGRSKNGYASERERERKRERKESAGERGRARV